MSRKRTLQGNVCFGWKADFVLSGKESVERQHGPVKRPPHRLRHASVGSILLAAFRLAFCCGAVLLCANCAIQGVLTGEVEAPMRRSSVVLTTADPGWFALAVLALLLVTGFFGFLTVLFARQLVGVYRS